eukprot:3914986-Amphidinium_carterae.1
MCARPAQIETRFKCLLHHNALEPGSEVSHIFHLRANPAVPEMKSARLFQEATVGKINDRSNC